jgi:quercetin 2,3-dioxygenase
VTSLDQRIVLAVDDGSLGPLLRVADDRLPAGTGYGRHAHRDVDVVAILLGGSLRHGWGDGARVTAGDVAVLRAGTGLDHDETAGDDGVRVLQCYLRPADPDAEATHDVITVAGGWVDLGRADARLWLGPAQDAVPDGLMLAPEDSGTVVVWQLDAGRPAWAD